MIYFIILMQSVSEFLGSSSSTGGSGFIKSLCVGLLLGLFVYAHDTRASSSLVNEKHSYEPLQYGLLSQQVGDTTKSISRADSLLARMTQGDISQRELFAFFGISPQKGVWNIEDLVRRQLFDTLARTYPHIDFFYGPTGDMTRNDPCHEPGMLGTVSLTTKRIIRCTRNIHNVVSGYLSAYEKTAQTKQVGPIYDAIYAELLDLVRLNEELHRRIMDMREKNLRSYPGSNTEDIYVSAVRWYLQKICGIKKLHLTNLHDFEEVLSDVATLAGGKDQGLTARFLHNLGHPSVYSSEKHRVRSQIFAYLGYDLQQTYSSQQRSMIQKKAETFLSTFFQSISVQDYSAIYRMYYVHPHTKYTFVRPKR